MVSSNIYIFFRNQKIQTNNLFLFFYSQWFRVTKQLGLWHQKIPIICLFQFIIFTIFRTGIRILISYYLSYLLHSSSKYQASLSSLLPYLHDRLLYYLVIPLLAWGISQNYYYKKIDSLKLELVIIQLKNSFFTFNSI